MLKDSIICLYIIDNCFDIFDMINYDQGNILFNTVCSGLGLWWNILGRFMIGCIRYIGFGICSIAMDMIGKSGFGNSYGQIRKDFGWSQECTLRNNQNIYQMDREIYNCQEELDILYLAAYIPPHNSNNCPLL